MRKNRYKIVRIREGEDTPCKECAVYWSEKSCTGNCQLIRRWRFVHRKFVTPKGTIIEYEQPTGYIYALRDKYRRQK